MYSQNVSLLYVFKCITSVSSHYTAFKTQCQAAVLFVQITAEEIKDNRAIVLELEAKNLDKKVCLLLLFLLMH